MVWKLYLKRSYFLKKTVNRSMRFLPDNSEELKGLGLTALIIPLSYRNKASY